MAAMAMSLYLADWINKKTDRCNRSVVDYGEIPFRREARTQGPERVNE